MAFTSDETCTDTLQQMVVVGLLTPGPYALSHVVKGETEEVHCFGLQSDGMLTLLGEKVDSVREVGNRPLASRRPAQLTAPCRRCGGRGGCASWMWRGTAGRTSGTAACPLRCSAR